MGLSEKTKDDIALTGLLTKMFWPAFGLAFYEGGVLSTKFVEGTLTGTYHDFLPFGGLELVLYAIAQGLAIRKMNRMK